MSPRVDTEFPYTKNPNLIKQKNGQVAICRTKSCRKPVKLGSYGWWECPHCKTNVVRAGRKPPIWTKVKA